MSIKKCNPLDIGLRPYTDGSPDELLVGRGIFTPEAEEGSKLVTEMSTHQIKKYQFPCPRQPQFSKLKSLKIPMLQRFFCQKQITDSLACLQTLQNPVNKTKTMLPTET